MTKPIDLGKLTAKEYRLIAELAGVSLQTVVKWFTNSLSVRPSTEKRIITAWLKVSSDMDSEIDKRIASNKVVIAKLQSMNKELQEQKQIIKDRLSIISEL